MLRKQIEIINKLGLHARAAAKLVNAASAFASDIKIELASQSADAKSIMSIMMLAASKGSIIEISCEGKDEKQAMLCIESLINNYFDEDE